jgi:hypothetical protein
MEDENVHLHYFALEDTFYHSITPLLLIGMLNQPIRMHTNDFPEVRMYDYFYT